LKWQRSGAAPAQNSGFASNFSLVFNSILN
jgi:hypothetical protein